MFKYICYLEMIIKKSHRYFRLPNSDTSMRCQITINKLGHSQIKLLFFFNHGKAFLIGRSKKRRENSLGNQSIFSLSLSLSNISKRFLFFTGAQSYEWIPWHYYRSLNGLNNSIKFNLHFRFHIIFQRRYLVNHNPKGKHRRHWSFQSRKSLVNLRLRRRIRTVMNIVRIDLYPIHCEEKTARSFTNVFNVEKPSVNYPISKFIYELIPMKDHSLARNVLNLSHN